MSEIKLRAIEPEDLNIIYNIENDRELWDVGTTNVPYSYFTLSQYIVNTQNDIYTDRQMRLMIEDSNYEVLGIIDLINYDPRHNHAEMGIVIKKEWRHQGIATQAIEKIKIYAKQIIHLHKLYVIVDQDNKAAICLFRKVGFTDEIILKDWLYDGKKYKNAIMLSAYND